MSPFKGATWKEADRKATAELRRAEQLKAQMKEHDYSECYCYALKNPPWGGYSIEEHILHEVKQRKNSIGRAEPQDTRKSRYSYRYANNALTGEIIIHEPFIQDLFTTTNAIAKRETVKEAGIQSLDTATDMLQNARISNSTKACIGTALLEEIPDEILSQIISNLDPYDLESLSEASRRLTILIGLVPCRDAFKWAVRRCQVYGHTRHASLCGDCVLAFEKRIGASICQGKHLYRQARR